jgi:hypothetical protein
MYREIRSHWILLTTIMLIVFLFIGIPRRSMITAAKDDYPELTEHIFLPLTLGGSAPPDPNPSPPPPALGDYVVIGWNDLGMHCYNPEFKDLAVLPPFNSLWAQVILRGDPPQIVTQDISVFYSFPDNTYSVGKSDFWEYDVQLFGVDLPANVGLTGNGLSGLMDRHDDHFVAEGIPLTEYNDGDHTTRVPYQLAEVIVRDNTGTELTRNQVVAPISTEMHCEYCHFDGAFDVSTGKVETNILTLHDNENLDEYPVGHEEPLMNRRPVLCAECHASNALAAPGLPGIPNFSKAMHEEHDGEVPDSTQGCYNCHPGPDTKCLRDVMSSEYNMGCTDCHGGMHEVSTNPNPWLNEPRCDDCHTEPQYAQNHDLFRLSIGHGGLYCEACHDSTHAIATSSEPLDGIKFVNLQGHAGTLQTCTVCHLTDPGGDTPHP